jgi:hypothetical protein
VRPEGLGKLKKNKKQKETNKQTKTKTNQCPVMKQKRNKDVWRSGGIASSFLISTLGSEYSASRSGRFIS